MRHIPNGFEDLIEGETFAHIATVDSDSAPHVSPVWIGSGDETLHVVTKTTSKKYRNIQENKKVALSILDPDDPYRSLLVRGEIVETDSDGGLDRLDELACQYWDVDEYPYERNEEWSLLHIHPSTVIPRDLR
jgi:PPOX class probable F420-dependent enzyme